MACVAAWLAFRERLETTEGRAVATEGGGTALGFANLALVLLAVDECERHHASLRCTTVDVWVQDPDGAADAVQFAHAAAAPGMRCPSSTTSARFAATAATSADSSPPGATTPARNAA
jgi:hypothetical protein